MFRKLLVASILFAASSPALAEWREAVSNNYIVYSDESEAALRERVVHLEKYSLVLQALTGAKRPSTVPLKATVFFVPTARDVQRTMPVPYGGVAGYYSTSSRGPYTVMPLSDPYEKEEGALAPQAVLQHELGHHFTYQYFFGAYPTWYSEGWADYVGVIKIDKNDVATLGLPNPNRYLTLRNTTWVPLKRLLLAKSYEDLKDDMIAVYSQGWILVHYLNNSPEGKAKLAAYLQAINRGVPFDKAATELGDLDALDREVRAYSKKPRLTGTAITFKGVNVGPVEIRTLSPAEQALIEYDLRMRSGVLRTQAGKFAEEVEAVARRFPNDPFAARVLAEAQLNAGNHAAAAAVANAWLAREPNNAIALMLQGRAQVAALVAAKSTDAAAWQAARAPLERAVKLMPRDPQIGYALFQTYRAQGALASPLAQNALMKALELMPQSDELRMAAVLDFEARGMIDDAIAELQPLLFGTRDENERSPRERARRERDRMKYALAGDTTLNDPKPHELMKRLEAKKAATTAAK